MELGNFFVLVLACILLVSGNVDAKVKHGEINSENDIEFLGTFYFLNRKDNVLDYEIKYPADQCCYRLVIFDETYAQWGAIRPHRDRLTCRNKIDRVTDLDYKIKLSDRDRACHMETDDAGLNWLVCRGLINFASRQRPQSYFVHLTNCRSNRKGLRNVTYSVHMTNGKNGLRKEFSENQKFMMETDLAFFLGYLVITILATRFRYVLLRKKLLHLTYRLFYSSLFLKTLSLLLLNIELSRFARTGLETTTLQDTAEILSCLSSILFVSVLLLVSKGFSITRAHASLVGTVKMIFFGLLYAACYAVVFFDQRVLLDPQDIIVSRTSLSGSGLIAVKFCGCILFVFGCFFSIKNYPRKALFYIPFTLFFSVWFVTEPIYRLLSLDEIYRVLLSPNIWNGIDLALSFAGHAYFLFITRPDRLNERFPFHLPAAKISIRDVDEDLDNPYQPTEDFYSIFQAGKKPNGTDTTLTIPDDPEHFLTPVLPFNTDSDECLVLPRPTAPVVPAAPTTAANIVDSPTVVPTVSAKVACETYSPPPSADFQLATSVTDLASYECRVPATRRDQKPRPHLADTMPETRSTSTTPTGFVAMPKVVAQATIKIKPATSSRTKALPTMSDIPKKDRAAVGISTVAVPKGGFSIFSVQKQQDHVTTPKVSDTDVQKEKVYSGVQVAAPKGGFSIFAVQKQQDTPISPKISDTYLMDPPQENACPVNEVRPNSTLPLVKSSIDSIVLPPIKTIEGPGSAVQLTKAPEKERLVTCRPLDKSLQTRATGECGSDTTVPNKSKDLANGTQKVRQITIEHVDDPLKTKATRESELDSKVPEGKDQTNDTSKVLLINVRPADDPFQKKAMEESRSAVQASKSEGQTKAPDNVRLISVRSVDEPLQTKASDGPGSVGQLPRSQSVVDSVSSGLPSGESKVTVSAPRLSAWTTDPVMPLKIECCQAPKPPADPLKMPFPVPAPKILNWTTELIEPLEIEHSKSSPGLISAQPIKVQESLSTSEPVEITSRSQGETFKKSLQDPEPHGPPITATDQAIGPRSVDQDWLPATDGGDFTKLAKKTQKEPSYRRFPKPTNLVLDPDATPSDEPQKAMDPKTKKRRLRRFLKLARKRKPKNKPAKAD